MTIQTTLLVLIFLEGCLSAPSDQKRILFGSAGEFKESSGGSMGSFGSSNFVVPTGFGGGGFSGYNPFLLMSGLNGGTVLTNGGGNHMCMPISQSCPMKCPNGYATNPMGCEECHCKTILTHTENTTHESKTTDHANALLVNTTQESKTTDHANTVTKETATIAPAPRPTANSTCDDAKTLCSLKCAGAGYLVDPSDCTFCVCKSDFLTPTGRKRL